MAPADKTTDGSITTSDGTVMTKSDVEFLMVCIQNTTGGQLLIDQAGVANALGMKNHRSVGNRVSNLKKKYNLPLGTGSGKATAEASSSTVPKTTGKVVKKTPTPRKKRVATSAKQLSEDKVKEDSDDDGEEKMEVEEPAGSENGDDTEEA